MNLRYSSGISTHLIWLGSGSVPFGQLLQRVSSISFKTCKIRTKYVIFKFKLGSFFQNSEKFREIADGKLDIFLLVVLPNSHKKGSTKNSERILINKVAKNILRLLPFTTVLGSFLIVLSHSVEIT